MGLKTADDVIDTTKGNLVSGILALAWPSVIQSILSNCYAMNDYLFIGHMEDKTMASIGTSALSSTVGLTIILFSMHNIIPCGCNAYAAQFRGAKDKKGLADTFRSGFYASIGLSTIISILGYIYIDEIAGMTNSSFEVTRAISIYFGVLLVASPAFGLLLLVDGFYKSNGDTRTPLYLEILSLILNTIGNYIFIFIFDWGIFGAAVASALSRLLPALIGLILLIRGRVGVPIMISGIGDWHIIKEIWNGFIQMAKVGVFESLSEFLYGFTFTILTRIAGELGAAEQGGLGAGMRGLEWISFVISEGFLVAAITVVGQNIGAGLQERALRGAIVCTIMSTVAATLSGLPFLTFPDEIASILSTDAEINKWAAIYIYRMGWVMPFVGIEMAAYGAFVGAGKANRVFFVNGGFNMLRIPLCVALMYKQSDFLGACVWSLGFEFMLDSNDYPYKNIGTFTGITNAIVYTSIGKAVVFTYWLSHRYMTGLYFTDSKLVETNEENDNKEEEAIELLQYNKDVTILGGSKFDKVATA